MAAGFHLMLCLPLPPMSVYPFSMVMVPMYVFLLPQPAIIEIGKSSLYSSTYVRAPCLSLYLPLLYGYGTYVCVSTTATSDTRDR